MAIDDLIPEKLRKLEEIERMMDDDPNLYYARPILKVVREQAKMIYEFRLNRTSFYVKYQTFNGRDTEIRVN